LNRIPIQYATLGPRNIERNSGAFGDTENRKMERYNGITRFALTLVKTISWEKEEAGWEN